MLFDLYSINLYELLKSTSYQGCSISLLRRFAIQILQAMQYIRSQNIIHCDLKPENILLEAPSKSRLKVIDFGSSCYTDQRIYSYL